MEFSSSDKASVLLNLLDRQIDEIQRKEQREQQWFEWSTSLLLATFGAVIAFSDRANPLPYPVIIKSVATILIVIPSFIATSRILVERSKATKNAQTVERIQQLLHLFEDGYYGVQSPYPPVWAGNLARGRLNRKTPVYYALILLLLMICVITTIWLIL